MNISSPEFRIWQHLEDHWNGTQLHHLDNIPSFPIDQLYYECMINSNRHITAFISTDEAIDDTTSLWTLIFPCQNLCNGYRSADTCRIRDMLLLLFLVPTCQISLLTFTIRFFMTYYCGWWCRESTHLQMWWQSWTAYNKTLQESWPVYEMGTYMDRELTEATSTVKSSSYIWIIG